MGRETTIKVTRTISMGHRLPSYKGICSSPHGHNVRIELVVRYAGLPGQKFIDFKYVDKKLKAITDPMDHAMVLYTQDPLVDVLQNMNFRVYLLPVEPTTEAVAEHILEMALKSLPELRIKSVTVFETDKYSATATTP